MKATSVGAWRWRLFVAGLIMILILAGCNGSANDQQSTNGAASNQVAQAQATPAPASTAAPAAAATPAVLPSTGSSQSNTISGQAGNASASLATAVRDVTQKVKPAVVQITNQQTQLGQFNQPFTVPAGVGSGVIYDTQGHILTNNHVVEGAQQLLVSLADGRSFPAKLIGADPQTDLAVVQISGNNLPTAQLGDSSQLQVGDWSVAIGNALALSGGPTVTAGVISALNRTVQEPGSSSGPGAGSGPGGSSGVGAPTTAGPFLFDVIQTSAPINPGNSGGPLVNLAGQVIGINTLVAGQAEPGVSAQGIGFAIAINTVKPIADQLVKSGQVVHPSLGIAYVPLNPALAAQLGVNQQRGDVIAQVMPGSPAQQAGLQRGDVVIKIDNTTLQNESDLARIINQHKPGDKVTLTIARNNQTMNVTVTLAQAQSA
jgi:serine protease Do